MLHLTHRFFKKFPEHHLGQFCTSQLDPQRASQATEDVAVTFENLVGSACSKLNEKLVADGLEHLFPYKNYSEVPNSSKYNADEVAMKGEKGTRRKVCASSTLVRCLLIPSQPETTFW